MEATGDRFRRLRVGVARTGDGGDEARAARLSSFADAIARRLRIVATGQSFADYGELLTATHEGAIDLAWLPPLVALRAQARGRTLPIALPVRAGASTFHGALFTAPAYAARSIAELDGARVAWVDKQSAAGYQVVRASLKAAGIDLAKAFASEAFVGSHEAVVDAVLSGEADVGATWVYVREDTTDELIRAGWGDAVVHVLALAGPIPVDVLAAGIGVPVALIRAVQRALCEPGPGSIVDAARALFSADDFIEARPEHLEPLSELLAHMTEEAKAKSVPPSAAK